MFCFFYLSQTYAQTIVTDRPDQTESSYVVPMKSMQLESGIQISHFGEIDQIKQVNIPTSLLRLGLSSKFELRLVHDYAINSYNKGEVNVSQSGIRDIQFGFKYAILDKKIALAILSHVSAPTGSSGFSNEEWAVINKLCLSHDIAKGISVGYNVGYDYFQESIFTYSMAIGFSVNQQISVYFEPYGDITEGTHTSNFDLGWTYLINDDLQADVSYGFGLNNNMNYTSLGISWRILNKE